MVHDKIWKASENCLVESPGLVDGLRMAQHSGKIFKSGEVNNAENNLLIYCTPFLICGYVVLPFGSSQYSKKWLYMCVDVVFFM